MSEAAAIATLPVVVRVLFMTCVAMLAGNAAVLILSQELMESADSNLHQERPRSQLDRLQPILADAAIAEPEYLHNRRLADLDRPPIANRHHIDMSASPTPLFSEGGIQVDDGLRVRDLAHTPHSYGRLRSTAVVGMIVNAAAIAVLVLFYLLIQRSVARQASVDATLKSYNRSLEGLVAQRSRELSELSGHLIRVAEEEKARLARGLHDELGASLTAMKFDMAYVAAKLKDSAPPLANRLQRAIDTLRCTFQLKQRLVQELRPTMLDHLGLAAAVRAHCNDFTLRTGVPCVADVAEDLNIDPNASIAVYRVVQESLTNIAKYAQASNVVVILQREREGLSLRVSDDGIGISVDATNKSGSYGLVGMRERVCQLRGTFAISSRSEERGTVVEAFIPLAAVHPDQEQIVPASVTAPPSIATIVARASTSAQAE